MPPPSTPQEFLNIVRKSGVVDAERLASFLHEFQATGAMPSDPAQLARLMVRRGLLTLFFAEQFLQGVWRGFHIGKYQILERIGSGGMGIVYLGQHQILGQRVAIKVLPLTLAKHPWFLDRFYREAQAVAALNHPNIVRAQDIDRDGELHFLVMEFVDGSSLQDLVGRHGPVSPLQAAHYIRQAAQGLQHLHEIGLVHRDIKPGNLLLDTQGVIKILDLGLARFLRDPPKEVVAGRGNERAMVGTDDYLAPEQIVNSEDVDIRADIYSLGATFYFLLTGCSPFESEERAYQKLIKHLAQRPKAIAEFRADVPAGLIALIDKMMAKNPWQRPQTPTAVVQALASWTRDPAPPFKASLLSPLCPALQPQGGLTDSSVIIPLSAVAGASSKFEIGASGPGSAAKPAQGSDTAKWVKVAPSTPPPASERQTKRPPPLDTAG